MENVIKRFLSSGCGYGYGDGSGSGYGDGYGDGSGDGDGYGSGDGDGDGSGYGDGYGSGDGSGYGYGYGSGRGDGKGVKSINGQEVCPIDGIPTVIYSVHGNYAVGAMLQSDLTLKPCYIAKAEGFFAHGKTLKDAYNDAMNKAMREMPVWERISKVVEQHPDVDAPIYHKELYSLHHLLTGSCTMGRDEFARAHNLDPAHGSMTMREFIALTRNAFGGDVIKQLADAYGLQDV